MTDSCGDLSQFEEFLLQLPDSDTLDLNPPNWPMPQLQKDVPPAPSPFEDYQQFPFHWTGESMRDGPVNLPPSSSLDRSALIANFPMVPVSEVEQPPSLKDLEFTKPATRKRRFKQLRRAMSLTHIRHKPTPPDTAPSSPTVPNQIPPSVGVKSLDSLAHWQLPDPTAPPASLDGKLIVWPTTLLPNLSSRVSYERPLDQLSPPPSIPSESDILPRDSLIDLGIGRSSSRLSPSPSLSPAQSPNTLYPPTLYDAINLSDSNVLEKNANGKVIAGTAEGLVAYITSPDCLDYEILSDFFMMYRKFMEPTKLLGLLCARFEWGLIRGAVVRPPDNEGMVRVRTFAALRHWLLNYFADDFAPSPSLRSQYVKAINTFGKDRRVKASVRDTKIITDLKRCWKKVGSIYSDDQGHENSPEGDITDHHISHGDNISSTRNRVPSLIFRATKKREEILQSAGTSQSQPDLRKRFIESGETGIVNSTRPPFGSGHARIHSTSTIETRPNSQRKHQRNLSAEARIIYSKNSSPALYQSFARGDGRDEWPPVIVRTDLLVISPKPSSTVLSWHRPKRGLFRSKRKKIAGEGVAEPKITSSLSCAGQLSDDEDQGSRRTRKTTPSVSTSEPARDRVDFLAAGMWASFISATSAESQVSLPRAEELGEALVQGYLQPMKIDDERALAVAASLDKGKTVATGTPVRDMTMASSESQVYQTTLSMSEIEQQLGSMRPASIRSPEIPDAFGRIDVGLDFSDERYSITPTPPPVISTPDLPVLPLRRRPGGNLRHAETIEQLQPRPETLISITSSMSSFSLALVDVNSNLAVPSISTESRSLRSLLDLPHDNRQSQSPTHRMSGLAMDFSRFQMPDDIESSDDENCDPADAVQKTLLKLEGKYVKKSRRRQRSSEYDEEAEGGFYEIAFSSEDLNEPSFPESVHSESPPESIMVERDEETRWKRRHKHVVDGQECDTPTRHGPFTSSSLFEFIDSPVNTDQLSLYRDDTEQVEDFYIPIPTVESALAELERDRLQALGPRLPSMSPPKPPETYHRSLASHLPFILQYDSSLLARQFTLIEKDICAEIDWAELIEPTWMERNGALVNVRDWKGFVIRNEGDRGLDTVMARFNLMAGWTTSEVVLTQSLAERTKVVSKFIHIAAACHRLHNYATLTQIVMGLQSNHVSALNKTWEGLSSKDKKRWQDLQDLVDSRKNWSRMRNEMEKSSIGPRRKGEGCIPFVGIFMSDLVHIDPRSVSHGKIDFEGLRLQASIIKRTLRMIELADEYDFKPEEGVGERCLWITAFDEAMLRRVAVGLE